MAKKIPVATIVEITVNVMTNKAVRKTLFGVYSDGTPRSFSDCVNGEILSPKDREKHDRRKKKKKRKKNSIKFS